MIKRYTRAKRPANNNRKSHNVFIADDKPSNIGNFEGGTVFKSGSKERNKLWKYAPYAGVGIGGSVLGSMFDDDEVQELVRKIQRGEPLSSTEERLIMLLQES